jgi:hypothetical protein
MWSSKPNRGVRLALLAAGLAVAWPADAQTQAEEPALVYRREVFEYPRGGRPDPFRSLINPEDLGYRIEDMSLTGVIYSPSSRVSVAVLTDGVSKKRFRLRTGESVGGITVAAIYPRRVDVVVNEFGVIRRETLQLRRPEPVREETGPQQQAPAAAQAAPQAPAVQNAAQNGRGK